MGQMLATAETDLQPARLGRPGQRIGQIDAQPGQQRFGQRQMMTAQGFAPAPPVKLEAWRLARHFTAALSAFTRSVFSQEKPPSFSGLRPKWP